VPLFSAVAVSELLMLGLMARAETDDITFGDEKREDARWFTRETLLSGSEVALPSPI
jgi:NADH pyrophosphatase NudC (nudix superfamily)